MGGGKSCIICTSTTDKQPSTLPSMHTHERVNDKHIHGEKWSTEKQKRETLNRLHTEINVAKNIDSAGIKTKKTAKGQRIGIQKEVEIDFSFRSS